MRRSIVITKAVTPAAVDNGAPELAGVSAALSAGSVGVSGAAWNLPATISVQQDGVVGLRQYALNAGAHTISVSGLPTGVTYNAGTESLEGASTGTASATVTFTLTLGAITVVDTATVSLYSPGSYPATHDFTGLPLTADGWTDLDAMMQSADYASSRFVYVDPTGGGSGQVYTQAQMLALGGDPTNPATPPSAYSSLSTAWGQVRDGFADVILLKRGETFGSLSVNKSGASNAGRLIVAAYGDPAVGRPVASVSTSFTVSHVVVSSFYETFGGTSGRDYRGTNVLVEDYGWRSPGPGGAAEPSTLGLWMLHGASGGETGGGTMRRCSVEYFQVYAGWSSSLHTPSRFEENLIARTFDSRYSNVYFGEYGGGIRSYGNQSILTTNAGFRQRGRLEHRDTWVVGNLCMGMQPGFSFGGGFDCHGVAEFKNNVSMHLPGPNALVRPRDADISGNIFVHPTANQNLYRIEGNWDGYSPDTAGIWGDTLFANNVFSSSQSAVINGWSNTIASLLPGATITFQNNAFLKPGGGTAVDVSTATGISYATNEYYSTAATSGWFTGQTYAQMIPSTGAAVTMADYPDPNRSIVTYMQSLGASPSSVEEALEWYLDGVPGNPSLAGALANRRGAWDERFTARAVINYIRAGFGMESI